MRRLHLRTQNVVCITWEVRVPFWLFQNNLRGNASLIYPLPLLSQFWPNFEHLKTSLSNVSTRVRWERGMFLKLIYQEKETLWFLTDTHLILKLLRSFTNLSGFNYCELFIPGHSYVRSLLWGEHLLRVRCVFSSTATYSSVLSSNISSTY